MARVEERLHAVETACDGVEHAMVRIHERVDSMSHEFSRRFDELQEQVYSRVGEIHGDVDRKISAHMAEEERLLTAKFDAVSIKVDTVVKAIEDERAGNKELFDKASKAAAWLIGGFLTIIVPGLGYVVGQILGHLPELARLVDLMERTK